MFDMQKEKYESPQMEIVHFESEDVITASGGIGGGESGFPTSIKD